MWKLKIGVFVAVIIVLLILLYSFTPYETTASYDENKSLTENMDSTSEFYLDVQHIVLGRTIDAYIGDKKIGTVKGNVVAILTDDLKFTDTDGNELSVASGQFQFLKKNNWGISSSAGKYQLDTSYFSWIAEKCNVYDADGTATGYLQKLDGGLEVETSFAYYDNNGNVIFTVKRKFLRDDMMLTIVNHDKIDSADAIMLAASYFEVIQQSSSSHPSHSSSK